MQSEFVQEKNHEGESSEPAASESDHAPDETLDSPWFGPIMGNDALAEDRSHAFDVKPDPVRTAPRTMRWEILVLVALFIFAAAAYARYQVIIRAQEAHDNIQTITPLTTGGQWVRPRPVPVITENQIGDLTLPGRGRKLPDGWGDCVDNLHTGSSLLEMPITDEPAPSIMKASKDTVPVAVTNKRNYGAVLMFKPEGSEERFLLYLDAHSSLEVPMPLLNYAVNVSTGLKLCNLHMGYSDALPLPVHNGVNLIGRIHAEIDLRATGTNPNNLFVGVLTQLPMSALIKNQHDQLLETDNSGSNDRLEKRVIELPDSGPVTLMDRPAAEEPRREKRLHVGDGGEGPRSAYDVYAEPGRGDHYYVKGRVNDYPVEFEVDTRATNVAMTIDMAAKSGIKEYVPTWINTPKSRIPGGIALADSIQIGRLRFSNVRITVVQGTNHVYLGMNILRQFTMASDNYGLVLSLLGEADHHITAGSDPETKSHSH